MRKKIFAAAAMMTILAATPVFAGTWEKDQVGWYYTYDTGGYARSNLVEIDGDKYYFDANGYMVTGWQTINGQETFFHPDGRLGRGWILDDGKWYYLNDDGSKRIGWFDDGKDMYYLYTDENAKQIGTKEGVMAIGTVTLSGVTYYFDAQGRLDKTVSPFTQDGITYRYREGALQWENINKKGDWIQYSSMEELASDIQEQLYEKYENESRTTENAKHFQDEAKLMLSSLIDESDVEIYIEKVLEELWGYYFSHEDDEDYSDGDPWD